jgi:predicted glycogen debranching enzyme
MAGKGKGKPLSIDCRGKNIDLLLETEYLRANSLGAYSSSTILGCNTRRYHGLLVGTAHPPVGRVVALSHVMEQFLLDGEVYDLATNEFADTFSPNGGEYLQEFRDDPAAMFTWSIQGVTITKQVLLADDANAVAIRYKLSEPRGKLQLRPFTAMRDFHSLRNPGRDGQLSYDPLEGDNAFVVRNNEWDIPPLHMTCDKAELRDDPQWWREFLYRVEVSRGQDGFEDIFSPGLWVFEPKGKTTTCQITACLGEPTKVSFRTVRAAQRKRLAELANSTGSNDTTTQTLAANTNVFLIERRIENQPGASILAGFPWFLDWGRDTFIALPGLLLETGRFDLARNVFRLYARFLNNGMIPNRFDDYGGPPHYNTVDASLWFVTAAERYIRAVEDAGEGDGGFWKDELLGVCRAILEQYAAGTEFFIHAAEDGLLWAGNHDTQLTWMDAKLGKEIITARFGKAVEINAMWANAHRFLADRLGAVDPAAAKDFAAKSEQIDESFRRVFWNDQFGWLNDVVNDFGADASLRPNQILAVALPHSPLSDEQQRAVVDVVEAGLLTPMGLRTLSPRDPRYRRRYGGCSESRERAYHQGTVWAWLIGPFIEAYLKVHRAAETPDVQAKARKMLSGFEQHIQQAGLGSVSEIFDGDWPHHPRGCFAQAWSVAEVLRARRMVERMGEPNKTRPGTKSKKKSAKQVSSNRPGV